MNKADRLIQQCIDELADDRVDSGVEALYELASMWKTAGIGRESFVDMCGYIEQSAAKKSDSHFVSMKINAALIKIREQKSGSVIVGVH